jgi:hypothetical protein
MSIVSNGIKFSFHDWDFDCDGDYGHIYFTVPADTFKVDGNNGSYSWESKNGEQIVSHATPCMECEVFRLQSIVSILQEAADDICINLTRVK